MFIHIITEKKNLGDFSIRLLFFNFQEPKCLCLHYYVKKSKLQYCEELVSRGIKYIRI